MSGLLKFLLCLRIRFNLSGKGGIYFYAVLAGIISAFVALAFKYASSCILSILTGADGESCGGLFANSAVAQDIFAFRRRGTGGHRFAICRKKNKKIADPVYGGRFNRQRIYPRARKFAQKPCRNHNNRVGHFDRARGTPRADSRRIRIRRWQAAAPFDSETTAFNRMLRCRSNGVGFPRAARRGAFCLRDCNRGYVYGDYRAPNGGELHELSCNVRNLKPRATIRNF